MWGGEKKDINSINIGWHTVKKTLKRTWVLHRQIASQIRLQNCSSYQTHLNNIDMFFQVPLYLVGFTAAGFIWSLEPSRVIPSFSGPHITATVCLGHVVVWLIRGGEDRERYHLDRGIDF